MGKFLRFLRQFVPAGFFFLVFSSLCLSSNHGASSFQDSFPLGVWFQDPQDAKIYKNVLGINLFVGIKGEPERKNLQKLKLAGIRVVCYMTDWLTQLQDEKNIVGWLLQSQLGDVKVNEYQLHQKRLLPPSLMLQRYERIKEKDPHRSVFLNLYSGNPADSPEDQSTLNRPRSMEDDYLKAGDVFLIDPGQSSQTASGDEPQISRYAKAMDRIHSWAAKGKPVWSFVETTSLRSSRKPLPMELHSMVWMAIIHGAQGIVYYCHALTPTFRHNAVLTDSQTIDAIRNINRQVQALAPILIQGLKSAAVNQVTEEDAKVAWMVRKQGPHVYLFSVEMNHQACEVKYEIQGLSADMDVEVLNEDRKLSITNGVLIDRYQPYQVHIYKIPMME